MQMIQFQPERWHACHEADWLSCEDGVNCYSYILNQPGYFWSVPGEGFVKAQTRKYFQSFDERYKNIAGDDFRQRLISGAIDDGLIPTETAVEQDGYYLAALFFADGEKDFHWYRKDDNGFWSHKNGRESASNCDDAGNVIKNPLESQHVTYPIFGGYFHVPRAGVLLKKQFPL